MSAIHTQLIEDHRHDADRSGEGAAVELADGTLYLVYGKFRGGGDASPARLVWRRSADKGVSWSKPVDFFRPPESWVNAMSVSLLRLQDGRLATLFLGKTGPHDCLPFWMTSDDDASTWSEPRCIIGNRGYYVVNNDRLVQLRDGRLLVPYAYSPDLTRVRLPQCGCIVSDDGGETWRHGTEELGIPPCNYRMPDLVAPDRLPALRPFRSESICAQEPGVCELTDGRIRMWVRSNGGYAYTAVSEDRGETWSPFRPLCETPMANGPATIKRVSGTGRLVMLHNDRTGVPYGDPAFGWRTPLAVSVSDDEGKTWLPHEPLIRDSSVNYCYYSLCFFGSQCLVTTYEGIATIQEDGTESRRNLKSLRALVVDNGWF